MVALEEDGCVGELSEEMRRRLDEVFGEAMPDTTADERDPEPPVAADAELLENRPPHHDQA